MCVLFGLHTTIRTEPRSRSQPYRDAAMDNTLIVHEMGHGISNRMTGGGTARCLQSLESRSLGEAGPMPYPSM